jgi:hypothetical protein
MERATSSAVTLEISELTPTTRYPELLKLRAVEQRQFALKCASNLRTEAFTTIRKHLVEENDSKNANQDDKDNRPAVSS